MFHQVNTPLLYPCADRVRIPYVGSDESVLNHLKLTGTQRPVFKPAKVSTSVNIDYLKKISKELSFSEDVVKDRCFHQLPYDDKYFREALDVSGLISPTPTTSFPMGRCTNRVAAQHMPCHIKTRTSHQLKPIKRKIVQHAIEMREAALAAEEEKEKREKEERKVEVQREPYIFLTETLQEEDKEAARKQLRQRRPDGGWDEFLISKLSETTARWIITHQISTGDQHDKLESLLDTYHGPRRGKVELISDSISEDGDKMDEVKPLKKWRKGNETLLDRVKEMQKAIGKPTDPYSDDSAAAFYRLPAGIRKAKRTQEKEEQGTINATTNTMAVKPYELPPPPTLRDSMHPDLTEMTRFDTANMFQQERLSGADQVYNRLESQETILLDTHNKYKKFLQTESPRPPQKWFPLTNSERRHKRKDPNKIRTFEKGFHRWNSLPKPLLDTTDEMNIGTTSADRTEVESPDMNLRKSARNNSTLIQIVRDWRNKWNLDMRYADATPDDLIKDMADIHTHIKLKAITTCARAAEYHPPLEPGIQLTQDERHQNPVRFLPERLFIALECLLEDEHEQVRRAAAITMYTLEKPVPKAEKVLRQTIEDPNAHDRWTACQCLAYYGECDSQIVGALVSQLLNSEDGMRRERAAFLLAKLSENSLLVHSMLAEQLNSSSWRHRVMTCKVIPKLYGNINKDMVHKLTSLMWTDWHTEVRKAAAQTLGKTCHGKDVHDELCEKIMKGTERQRTEAISKVGQLGIMTAKLMPPLLNCFHDEYVSVRIEACIACNNLMITDERVVKKLIFLATYDPIWKIKALAMQALGNLDKVDDDVRRCLLWAFRYEEQPGVRAEACHTLIRLGLKDEDVAQTLQERYLVEPHELVRSEITHALEVLGISVTKDLDMVIKIKNEVRKICTRDNICAHITTNDARAEKQADIKHMIDLSAENLKKTPRELVPTPPRKLRTPRQRKSKGKKNVTKAMLFDSKLTDVKESMSLNEEIRDTMLQGDLQEGMQFTSRRSRSGSLGSSRSSSLKSGLLGPPSMDYHDVEIDLELESRVSHGSQSSLTRILEEEEVEVDIDEDIKLLDTIKRSVSI